MGVKLGLSLWGKNAGWRCTRIGYLKRIFKPQKNEVIGEWRRIYNQKLYNLCALQSIIWVIKSRRKRWTGHVARMGRGEVHSEFWWDDTRAGDNLEDSGLYVRIILKRIFKKWDGDMDWVNLTQDMDRWRALVSDVINHQITDNPGNFLTSWELVSFSRRTSYSMELVSQLVCCFIFVSSCIIETNTLILAYHKRLKRTCN